ncbi:MAG: GTPase ObgE [Candidatus Saccharimonadales bacterium]
MFVDTVAVRLEAGNGGDGIVNFRREKFVDKGGPDGGNGGNGGDIIVKASRNLNTLALLRYKKVLRAEAGQSGGRRRRHGKNGQDLEIAVPVGTVITDDAGEVLADLTEDGQSVVAAKGGKGGFGNAHFVSSRRQVPMVAEKGERGQVAQTVFEMKMIADIGIVGLPNAGKSTLLSVISNARPAIANYPFTTLTPNLGVVDIDKTTSLLFADIPGLIAGAHTGKGLGDEFLRHIERTNVLVHLIDAYAEDIAGAYKTIVAELAAYKVDLSKRPQLVVLTKIEGLDEKTRAKHLKTLKKLAPRGTPVIAISALSGMGLAELLRTTKKQLTGVQKKATKKKLKASLPVIGLRPDEAAWQVKKMDRAFLVTGTKIERFAKRTRFDDYWGRQRLRDIMGKMGITRELTRQGWEPDQKIIIGDPKIDELEGG